MIIQKQMQRIQSEMDTVTEKARDMIRVRDTQHIPQIKQLQARLAEIATMQSKMNQIGKPLF